MGRVSSCFSASSSRLDLSYQILDYLEKDAEPRSGSFFPLVRHSPNSLVSGRSWFIGLSQSIYPKSLPYASYNRFSSSCALLISFSILNPNLQLSSRKTLSQYLLNSDFMLTSEMKLIRPKAERQVHWHENQAK